MTENSDRPPDGVYRLPATHFLHRDGKICYWDFEASEWRVPWTPDYPEVWTDEGEEPPDFLPCARAHHPGNQHPCAATTAKGVPCRRLVSEGWTYCGAHRHLRNPDEHPYV